MSITDNVINIALLGTANREMTSGELPEDLVGIWGRDFLQRGGGFFRLLSFRVGTFEVERPCSDFGGGAGNETLCRAESGCDIEYSARRKIR